MYVPQLPAQTSAPAAYPPCSDGHQAACRCRLHAQGFNLPAEGSWFWVEGMIDLFFYVDLVLNFFVAYEVCQQG